MSVLIEVDTADGVSILSVDSIESINPGRNLSDIDDEPVAIVTIKGSKSKIMLKQSYISLKRLLSGNGIIIIRG